MVTPSGVSKLWVFLGVKYFILQVRVKEPLDPCTLHRLGS